MTVSYGRIVPQPSMHTSFPSSDFSGQVHSRLEQMFVSSSHFGPEQISSAMQPVSTQMATKYPPASRASVRQSRRVRPEETIALPPMMQSVLNIVEPTTVPIPSPGSV